MQSNPFIKKIMSSVGGSQISKEDINIERMNEIQMSEVDSRSGQDGIGKN